MPKEVDILSYLPPVLHEIKELVEIANIENHTLSELWNKVDDVLNNQFISSINTDGAERYEKMLNISAPATDTLETRRFRILTKNQEQAPYTYKVTKQLLNSLLGEGHYEMTRNVAEKSLTVKVELTVKGQFEAVKVMLERITPQNMILTVELRCNQNSLLKQYRHSQLAAYTHQQLRSEVLN
ncbi:putative phage tail protein [Paenibacillus lentus]|uniref:DUF2313 domain-containing protein n=1 Tax=Paenibacillus lentus TaxID=1338368 RepID=A0A3Q8SEB9_9BACL|nr:putative phage tail protein [Paenibacillus lentus]AZK48784.1 DUF2313 domain-containing protein [Paenibacillus lentus]